MQPAQLYNIFLHYLINRTILEQKNFEHKMYEFDVHGSVHLGNVYV
jgi:hypothetical protein